MPPYVSTKTNGEAARKPCGTFARSSAQILGGEVRDAVFLPMPSVI